MAYYILQIIDFITFSVLDMALNVETSYNDVIHCMTESVQRIAPCFLQKCKLK